jgi:hypothetical protein
MPGVGLHDVAMGDQTSAHIRAAQGIVISVAQGLLWLGRLARHAYRAMMDRALRGAAPMPIFRHCLGKRWVNAISRAVAAADSPQFSPNSARPMTDSGQETTECGPPMPKTGRTIAVTEYG